MEPITASSAMRVRAVMRSLSHSGRALARQLARCATSGPLGSPAVVGEGFVRLRHAEDVVLPLERAALLGLRVEQLVREPLGHRLLAALAGGRRAPTGR